MDEGWATTFEYLIGTADVGKRTRDRVLPADFRVNGWINDPSPLEDLPIITPEDVLKRRRLRQQRVRQGRTRLPRDEGSARRRRVQEVRCTRTWIAGTASIRSRGISSTRSTTSSGKNLNWFWNEWYFTNSYIDLAVTSVTKAGNGYTVVIDNIGGMPAPVDRQCDYTDGSSETVHQTPAIWAADLKRATVSLTTSKTLKSLTLDGGIWMDADTTNNSWGQK